MNNFSTEFRQLDYPLQLIHPSLKGEKSIVATIYADRIIFHHRRMQKIANFGIPIPYDMEKEFEGANCIYPKSPRFIDAFIRAYFPSNLKTEGYTLRSQEQGKLAT
ncbi:MAG: hypothetical protein H0V82_05880 [Candidatus Protochlamydia sp.]|nr:hypothetical protein [Candidatus Protochlamydia sp.]